MTTTIHSMMIGFGMINRLCVLSVIILGMINCSNNSTPKEHPAGVPKTAIWSGGADGGCWVDCQRTENEKYNCAIYYENGTKWYDGIFILVNNGIVDSSNIQGYDGEKILLKDGAYLRKE